jgi:Na+/proline symporter
VTTHASHDLIPGWPSLAIYVAGVVVTARIFYATSDEDDGETRFVAFIVGLIWPLALAVLALGALAALPTLGARTRRDRQVRAAAGEREHRRLAARTAELEAENDRLRKAAGEP